MSKSIFKRIQLSDIIGAGCGIFLLIVLIVDVITGMMPVTAGVKDEEIPPEAVTAIGVAPGRNDEVYVQVAATPDRIHQIKILYHIETDKIGTKSIKEIPQMIYDTQKVTVDAVTGSTLKLSEEKDTIALNLQVDESICTMYEYFDIFLNRMLMCRAAAEMLGCKFRLTVNGGKVL